VIELLKTTHEILTKHKIHYFLLYGAALGLYCEKRILPWDGDIDIGVFIESYDELLRCKKEFEKNGYRFIQKKPYGNIFICKPEDKNYYIGKEKRNYEPYHVSIAFFIKDKNKAVEVKLFYDNWFKRWFGFNNQLYMLFTLLRVKHYVYPLRWFTDLEYINGYPIPAYTECYLRYIYGDSWRVPVKTWDKKKHFEFNKSYRRCIIWEKKNRLIYYNNRW